MKLIIKAAVYTILTMSLINVAHAGDADAGRKKASSCFSCHGVNGIGTNNQNPNLAGQKKAYLIKATEAYRDGGRNDQVMKTLVKSLSDEDIENIAAYYSELK
ncbi:c-type cytochrome [Pseudomonadota bacterium]